MGDAITHRRARHGELFGERLDDDEIAVILYEVNHGFPAKSKLNRAFIDYYPIASV